MTVTSKLGHRLVLASAQIVALVLLLAACASGSDAPAPVDTAAPVSSDVSSADTEPTNVADTQDDTAPDAALVSETCEAFPSFSEGSFYVEPQDQASLADDLVDGEALPLQVRLVVLDAAGCTPLVDRSVDLWGAAPDGRYSGVSTQPDGVGAPAVEESWLRGRQRTDADGTVQFDTVVPGWIPGQAPHLHVTIPVDDSRSFTARLVLPDEVTEDIYDSVYASRGPADITAAMESERDPGIARSIVELAPDDGGYRIDLVIAVDEAELRGRPLSAMQAAESPADDADDALVESVTRNFDQIGGELQEMFNRAGAELGVEPEALYAEFRFVTSDNTPDLAAIAERLGVTQDALALALPLLAGGAPAPGG